MRTWARGAAVLGTAAALGVGCSLVVDTSGLAGDVVVVDGGPPNGDAAAPIDARVADAGPGADAPSTRWCAQQSDAAFCDDFDAPAASLPGAWDDFFTPPGSTLRVDGANTVSAPGALLAVMPNPGSNSYIGKAFSPHASVRVALDLLLEASDPQGYGVAAVIHLDPPQAPYTSYSAAVVKSGGLMFLYTSAVGGNGGDTQTALHRDFSTWRRVQLEIALLPTPHAVVYDGAGAMIVSAPMAVVPQPTNATRVVVGVNLSAGTAPSRVRIDNVLMSVAD